MDAQQLRLVFLGSDAIALPVLDWLAGAGSSQAQLVGIFTQPDRPAGRGQWLSQNPVKGWASARGLPVFQPDRLAEAEQARLASLSADLGLVFAYGRILRTSFIATPRLGMVNLHASLLPRYRGASPIQTAVASGERSTGVTMMRVVRELDAGPVAGSVAVPIGPLDTSADVERTIASACPALIERTFAAFAAGGPAFAEQDHTAATYCRRLAKEDGALDFGKDAPSLAARINGLHPWPGCRIEVSGEIVGIGLGDAVDAANAGEPGEVLGADENGLLVGTGRGVLRLRRLQRAGGRMLAAGDFLRGFAIAKGARIPSHPMPELVGRTPFR